MLCGIVANGVRVRFGDPRQRGAIVRMAAVAVLMHRRRLGGAAVHDDDENEDDVIVHGENDVEVRGLIGSRQSSNIDRRRSTSKGINGVIRKRLDEWTARQASKRIKEKRTARLEEMAERAELQNTDGGGDDYDDIDIEGGGGGGLFPFEKKKKKKNDWKTR